MTYNIVKVKNEPSREEQEKLMLIFGFQPVDLNIPETSQQSLLQTLGIAHYNLAVEYEHMSDYKNAMSQYLLARNKAS